MYNKLITKPFIHKYYITNINITKHILINALFNCLNNIAFSTFPYIVNKYNSKQSLKKTNSGNCIALSLFIKDFLKNKYNITSFLIPATIPNNLKLKGYLDISHVALCIPKNEYIYYILDPAFYFLEPLEINLYNKNNNDIKSMCIYSNNIYNIKSYLEIKKNKIIFNNFQQIPKNTYYCECYYSFNSDDKWKYILREIINPDNAITSFFIKIKKKPFLVSTYIDYNNMTILKDIIFKLTNKVKIDIKNDYNLIKKSKNDLTNTDKNIIKMKLKKYLNNDILKYIFNN
jgi:hypothetical protein